MIYSSATADFWLSKMNYCHCKSKSSLGNVASISVEKCDIIHDQFCIHITQYECHSRDPYYLVPSRCSNPSEEAFRQTGEQICSYRSTTRKLLVLAGILHRFDAAGRTGDDGRNSRGAFLFPAQAKLRRGIQ